MHLISAFSNGMRRPAHRQSNFGVAANPGTTSSKEARAFPGLERLRETGSYVCTGCPNVTQNPLMSRMMNSRMP